MQCKLDAYQFQNANEHNECVDFMQNSQTVVNLMRKVKISHTKINNKKKQPNNWIIKHGEVC